MPARKPVSPCRIAAPAGIGVLTEGIIPELVDEVIDLSGCREKRHRLLPARADTGAFASGTHATVDAAFDGVLFSWLAYPYRRNSWKNSSMMCSSPVRATCS